MIGRFLTERPDQLAVAIVRVGDSNALRFEFMEAGPANMPEFGTIDDPDGFKGLCGDGCAISTSRTACTIPR